MLRDIIERFAGRFEIWRDERQGGPAGPRSGDKPPYRNPLLWGLVGAIVSLLPPYHIRSSIDILLLAAAVLFIILYIIHSRFAWHVLAAAIFVVFPLFVLLSPAWRAE